MVTIYHNPRCSKSRETLALLRDRGIEPQVIEYLDTPPSADELARLLTLLNMTPREIVRNKETEYAKAGLNNDSTNAQILNAMIEHPVLIERPIVVVDDKAVLGRPPQNILKII